MDPVTNAVVGAAARASDPAADEAAKVAGNLLQRLLGPSADVVGADWAEQLRRRNLQKLLAKTERRSEANGEGGVTKPRLAVAAFESVQYGDDEILTEYVSGVLASSRSETGGTDAGLPWTALISRLSSVQLRLHYILYSVARPLVSPLGSLIYKLEDHAVVMPLHDVYRALDLTDVDTAEVDCANAFLGLLREGLISERLAWGPASFLEEQENVYWPYTAEGGKRRVATEYLPDLAVRYEVNNQGALLYLWGLGAGTKQMDDYLDEGLRLEVVEPEGLPAMPAGAVLDSTCWKDAPRQSESRDS